MNSINNYIEFLFSNKKLLSGIAILMVLFYHCPWVTLTMKILSYSGFLGVDIFFLFTGFGLCYSIQKNDIGSFYKRRLYRIFPMFLILAIITTLLSDDYSWSSWFFNLSTLSYYGIGGKRIDWYLSSLCLFYLLFPLFYKSLCKCNKKGLYITAFQITILVLLSTLSLDWSYECALGRLGIYITGIACFLDDENKTYKKMMIIHLILLPIVIALYIGGWLHTYIMMFFIAPFVIIGICAILIMANKKSHIIHLLNLVGGVTLEIYVANCISMKLQSSFEILNGVLLYWILNLLIVPLIIILNIFINRVIEDCFE